MVLFIYIIPFLFFFCFVLFALVPDPTVFKQWALLQAKSCQRSFNKEKERDERVRRRRDDFIKNHNIEFRKNFDWMKFFTEDEVPEPPLPPQEETMPPVSCDVMREGENLFFGPRSQEQIDDDEQRRRRREFEEAVEQSRQEEEQQ